MRRSTAGESEYLVLRWNKGSSTATTVTGISVSVSVTTSITGFFSFINIIIFIIVNLMIVATG